MSDEHRPEDPTVGSQPQDVEQLQYGKGPGPTELSPPDSFLGHPKGLWVLFITEMWERFSYYGMRALLVLYLISSTSDTLANGDPNTNPGFGWTEDSAYSLYGWYTWAVYLTPIAGGWLADKFLGTHRSMIIGAWVISAGHITLALTELFGISAGEAVTMQSSPGALLTFMLGLFLIVVGTGFFKPCVSVMVGQLYSEGDVRRDSGFSIFYMGINLGAFLSPLIAGTLGETVGWHWGFGSAAVGMIAGLITYQILRPKYLKGIGDPPAKDEVDPSTLSPAEKAEHEKKVYEQTRPFVRQDWERIAVILVLAFVGNIFFWAAFEQAGTSMNVFAAQQTDRSLYGLMGELGPRIPAAAEGATAAEIQAIADQRAAVSTEGWFPATWYQSVNALTIVIFAPLFGAMWVWLAKRKLNPSSPMKFALGLYLLGLAFIAMIFGAIQADEGGLAAPHWLFITYVVYTWGELCLSPVGLSLVTKLAPYRLQSLMMGVWFFTFSLANLLAAQIARISTRLQSGELEFIIPGMPGFYLMLVIGPIAAGVLIMVIAPILKRMMHGVK